MCIYFIFKNYSEHNCEVGAAATEQLFLTAESQSSLFPCSTMNNTVIVWHAENENVTH